MPYKPRRWWLRDVPGNLMPEGLTAAHKETKPKEIAEYKERFPFSNSEHELRCGRLSTEPVPEKAEFYKTRYQKFKYQTKPVWQKRSQSSSQSRVWRLLSRVSFSNLTTYEEHFTFPTVANK